MPKQIIIIYLENFNFLVCRFPVLQGCKLHTVGERKFQMAFEMAKFPLKFKTTFPKVTFPTPRNQLQCHSYEGRTDKNVEQLVPISWVCEESNVPERKSINHFWVSRVHFQNHLVIDKADNIRMQHNARLDNLFSRFTIYKLKNNLFRQMANKWDGSPLEVWGLIWFNPRNLGVIYFWVLGI